MTVLRRYLPAGLTAGVLVLIVACSDPVADPSDEAVQLRPVEDLKAYAAGPTSVGLVWSRSPDTSFNVMTGHRISIRNMRTGAHLRDDTADRAARGAVVGGLNEGDPYEFGVSVTGPAGDSLVLPSPVRHIVWAGARRSITDGGGQPIRLYESASTMPSALVLSHPADSSVRVTMLQNPTPLADTSFIDLYLRTDGPAGLRLRSAHLYEGRTVPRMLLFSSVTDTATDLNYARRSPPDSLTYIGSNTSVNVTTGPLPAGIIYYVRTADNHHARLLVRRQAGGSLIGGTSPDRYVDLELSYQPTPFLPYVRRR